MDKDTIVLCCNAQVHIFVMNHYRPNVFCGVSWYVLAVFMDLKVNV
jgi:hypothetical protein